MPPLGRKAGRRGGLVFAAVPPNAARFFVGERQVDQPTDVKVVKIDRGILLAGGKTIPESR